MLTLYHAPGSASSQKVRLVLAEKGCAWHPHAVNLFTGDQHRPAFRALNPRGEVPVLVHHGRVLTEANLIAVYLDDAFPEPALTPSAAGDRDRMRRWLAVIDDDLHRACGVLSYALAGRMMLADRTPGEIGAVIDRMPDAEARAVRRRVIEQGMNAPDLVPALARHVALLDDLEQALADGPWLAGNRLSLADLIAVVYVWRLDHLGLDALWRDGLRPHLAAWARRLMARPSYRAAVGAYLPTPLLHAMRAKGAAASLLLPHVDGRRGVGRRKSA